MDETKHDETVPEMDKTKNDEAVVEMGEIKIDVNIPPGEKNGDVESGTTINETTTVAATNETKVAETAPKNGDGCSSTEVHMFDTENKKENGGCCSRSAKIFISIAIVIGVALTAVIVYYTVPGVRGGKAEINNEKVKINAEQISGDEDGVKSRGVTGKSSDTDSNTNMISSTGIVNPTPSLPETTPNPKSVAKIPGMTNPEPIPRGSLRSLRMPARPPSKMTPKPTTVETKQIDTDAVRSLRMPARPSQTMPTTPKEKPIDISKLRSLRISVCTSQETTPEPTSPKPQPIVNGQLRILRRRTRLSPETTPSQATKKSVTTQNPTSPEQKQMVIGELKLQRMSANKPQETTPNTTETEPLSVVNLRNLRSPVALAPEMTTTLTTSKFDGLLSLTRTQRLTSQTVQPTNPESKPIVISGVQSTEKTAIPSTPQKKSVICDCETSRTGSTTRTPGTDEAAREGDSSIAGATSPLDTPAADDLLDEDKGDSGGSVSVTGFIIKGGVGHSDDQGLPLGKGVTESIGLPKRKGKGVTESIGLPKRKGKGVTQTTGLPKRKGKGVTQTTGLPKRNGKGVTESTGLPKRKDKDVPDKGRPVDFEGENPNAKRTRSPGKVLADKAELVDFEEENPIFTAKNTRFPGNVLPDQGGLVDFEGENPFLGEDGQPIDFGGSNSDDQLKEDGFLTDEHGDAIGGGWMDAARNPIINTGEDTKSKTPLPRGP